MNSRADAVESYERVRRQKVNVEVQDRVETLNPLTVQALETSHGDGDAGAPATCRAGGKLS